MGFLSAYSTTTKVMIGDDERGYWVELKDCLSQGDKEKAEQALTTGQLVPGQDIQMVMDVARYRQLTVLASVKAWNLDDEAGAVWPIDLAHVQMLPGSEFDRLWTIVDKSNAPASSGERKRFPDGSGGGYQDGDTGAAVSA